MIQGTITLVGLTARQCEIADDLWAAHSFEDLDRVFAYYGQEAVAIHDLMLAAAFDRVAEEDLSAAKDVLSRF